MRVPRAAAWSMSVALVLFMTGLPFLYYRHTYTHARRLRVVTEGKLYRSGYLTADGLRDAIRTHKIRTVLNLMDEDPEPNLPTNLLNHTRQRESDICRELGARMIHFKVDLLPAYQVGKANPKAVDDFRALLDDPANHPILIHCKAGLHRTGVLCGLYRMEYEGWSRYAAMHEVRANGFGWHSSCANDYIEQYVYLYQPRERVTSDE